MCKPGAGKVMQSARSTKGCALVVGVAIYTSIVQYLDRMLKLAETLKWIAKLLENLDKL